MSKDPVTQEEPKDVSAWVNIGKTVFLIATLVAAWFVLEWLMGSRNNAAPSPFSPMEGERRFYRRSII